MVEEDKNLDIIEEKEAKPIKKIKTFCIGDGPARTKFFLELKAKVLIMTMPDLETYHIKRSKVFPVHYVYLFHSMNSTHMEFQKNAFDHFDSIFCVGPYQIQEIRATEQLYNLKQKKLIFLTNNLKILLLGISFISELILLIKIGIKYYGY